MKTEKLIGHNLKSLAAIAGLALLIAGCSGGADELSQDESFEAPVGRTLPTNNNSTDDDSGGGSNVPSPINNSPDIDGNADADGGDTSDDGAADGSDTGDDAAAAESENQDVLDAIAELDDKLEGRLDEQDEKLEETNNNAKDAAKNADKAKDKSNAALWASIAGAIAAPLTTAIVGRINHKNDDANRDKVIEEVKSGTAQSIGATELSRQDLATRIDYGNSRQDQHIKSEAELGLRTLDHIEESTETARTVSNIDRRTTGLEAGQSGIVDAVDGVHTEVVEETRANRERADNAERRADSQEARAEEAERREANERTRAEEAEAKVKEQAEAIGALTEEKTALETSLGQLETELSNLEREAQEASQQSAEAIAERDTRIEELNNQKTDLLEQIADLNKRLLALTGRQAAASIAPGVIPGGSASAVISSDILAEDVLEQLKPFISEGQTPEFALAELLAKEGSGWIIDEHSSDAEAYAAFQSQFKVDGTDVILPDDIKIEFVDSAADQAQGADYRLKVLRPESAE